MKRILVSLILFIFCSAPLSVLADGGMIAPEYEEIYEPYQVALIVYDDGREDLYLEVGYEGDSSEFVWIVPTPHYPEVEEASKGIFTDLLSYTQIYYEQEKLMTDSLGLSNSSAYGDVILYSRSSVGAYDVSILSSGGTDALFDWLNENGYKLKDDAKDILDWYVKKGWYFTAMRVDHSKIKEQLLEDIRSLDSSATEDNMLEVLADEYIRSVAELDYEGFLAVLDVMSVFYREVSFLINISEEEFNSLAEDEDFSEYTEEEWQEIKDEAVEEFESALEDLMNEPGGNNVMDPVKISFASEAMVYPLKISQISTEVPEDSGDSAKTSEIILYVLNDKEVSAPEFTKTFGAEVSKSLIQGNQADLDVYLEAYERDSERSSDVRQIQTALELYFNSEGSYPEEVEQGGTIFSETQNTSYMINVPSNPTPGGHDYTYTSKNDGQDYELKFSLEVGSFNGKGECVASPAGIDCAEEADDRPSGPISFMSDDYSDLMEVLGEKEWYLTKLTRQMARAEMDDDLYLSTDTGIEPSGKGMEYLRAKSRDARRVSDIKQMMTANELYYNDNSEYVGQMVAGEPVKGDDGTTYMTRIPSDPKADGTTYNYEVLDNGQNYRLRFELEVGTGSFGYGPCTADTSGFDCGDEFKPEPLVPLSESYGNQPALAQVQESVVGSAMSDRLKGRIVLRVEEKGEAYYINPGTRRIHFLGRPDDAFAVMREQGVGIRNADLYKIPIGTVDGSGRDTDGDGLSDYLEETLGLDKAKADTDGDGYRDGDELLAGYSPWGEGRQNLDSVFADKQGGRILLQVERNGEAWYINPTDGKRYFLGRPADAFAVMRALGLGISNNDFDDLTE